MSSPVASVVYTLLTITYGGDIKHTDGFKSLSTCQEGVSLALTGMTLEAREAQQSAQAADQKKRLDALNALNLWTNGKRGQGSAINFGTNDFADLNRLDEEDGGYIISYSSSDIKVADCVIEPAT